MCVCVCVCVCARVCMCVHVCVCVCGGGGEEKGIYQQTVFNLYKDENFHALVRSVLLYVCGTWSVTQANLQRSNTFHIRCIRSILGVSRWNKIKNSDILEPACENPIAMTIQRQ